MSGEADNAESKYELREVIGKGAFGEVNLVVEKQSKQRYVLKRIKMARQSEWQRRATRQEIEIVSRLRHPFIMPYKEHWVHHGHTINVVYGYCEKGDLTTAITKQRGKLFPEETLRLWLAELLLAVDYMHKQNVLHRDIKTQNILLTGEGDVQIGDFGLSTVRVHSGDAAVQQAGGGGDDHSYSRMESSPSILLETADGIVLGAGEPTTPDASAKSRPQSNPVIHLQHQIHGHNPGLEAYTNGLANAAHMNGQQPAQAGEGHKEKDKELMHGLTPVHDPKAGTRNDYALVGTPHFMSPELLSSQKYSYETDIWSLGVVMYELTTLKPPFNAFNLAGLVAKIKRAALPPIPSSYSADWTSILKSMLRKDPSRRASPLDLLAIPSMQQALQQALQRALVMAPDYVMPNIPRPPTDANGGTPGFCFDVTGAAAAAVGPQRTPSAGGPTNAVTPVLVQPVSQLGAGLATSTMDDESLLDTDSSPMSKFPDLAATSSPLPNISATVSGANVRVSAPNLAADARRSKTPAVARRAGTATAPGMAPGAGAKCMASPQRPRAAAATVAATAPGATRSKTPCRNFVPTKTEVVRKPSARAVAAGVAVAASPREASGSNLTSESSAGRVTPASPARHKGGAVSGPTARVPTLGSFRSASSRRGAMDATAPSVAVPPIMIVTPRDGDSDVTTPDTQRASTDRTNRLGSMPPSAGGAAQKTSPGSGATAAPPSSRTTREVTAVRTVQSTSINTMRTSRAALAAAAAATNTTSPTAGPAAAKRLSESSTAAGARRGADGTSAPSAAPGTKRIISAVAGAAATAAADGSGASTAGSARSSLRAVASPGRPVSAAAASGTTTSASMPRVRRALATTATAGVSKEAPEAASTASGVRQRIRRTSYVSYGGKAAAPEPASTSARGFMGAGAAGTAAASAGGAASARANTSSGGVVAREDSTLSSHALSASDAAVDSFSGSGSGSSPEMPSNGALVATSGLSSGVPPMALPEDESGRQAAAVAVAAAFVGGAASEVQGAATAAAAGTVAPGGIAPWRVESRSRSLVSMTTESSELSLPDGRYPPFEHSNGGLGENDSMLGPSIDNGTAAASPLSGRPGGAPSQWNSNQLFSSSYNSLTGALSDTTAAAAAATALPTPTVAPLVVDGVSPIIPPSAAATLADDLPRRVSISAFAPHLLYGAAAAVAAAEGGTAAAANPDGNALTDGSEASTTESSPMFAPGSGKVVPLGRRLVVHDTGRVGDESPVQSLRPFGGMGLTSPSPSHDSAATTPVSISKHTHAPPSPSPSASPRTTPTASPSKLSVGSAAAVAARQTRQPVVDAAAARQARRAGAATATAQPAAAAAAAQPRRTITRTGSAGAGTTGAARASSGVTSSSDGIAKRTRATQLANAADAAAVAAEAAAVAAALNVGAPLKTVTEDTRGEEAEFAQYAAEAAARGATSASSMSALVDKLQNGAGNSGLTDKEREQLALLQRVVSLASSLWEEGRDEELGMVLSSTLSRPLERRATKDMVPCVSSSCDGPPTQGSAQQPAHVEPQQAHPSVVEPGDAVRVTGGLLRGCEAVVRYKGPCHWGAGVVLGLELPPEAAVTAADTEDPGTRDGVTYFRCQAAGSRGAFVFPEQVVKLA